MRYSENLIKEIIAELEKVPIIRQVCAKFGIDHSTFYRWMIKHPSFMKEVLNAQFLGRQRLCDSAESVVFKGIQNQDFRASSFYLTHNHPQYMSAEKGKYHFNLNKMIANFSENNLPKNYITFEKVFEMFLWYEDNYEPEFAEHIMKPIIDLFCVEDEKLIELFYASYSGWKNNKKAVNEKIEKSGLGPEDEDEENYDE